MNFIDATRYYWCSRDCDDLEKFEREYWAWRYSEYFEFDLLAKYPLDGTISINNIIDENTCSPKFAVFPN